MRLFPFQEVGRDHLLSRPVALLADDMGLGKTIQALRATEAEPDRRVTVLCPAILVAEWRDAYLRHGDVPRTIAVLGQRGCDPATADVTIASYDRAARPDAVELLRSRGGAHLVLDEAQYLKEPSAKRSLAALGSDGISSSAHRVSFLSGTPAPNHAGELYAMLDRAGLWSGDYWDFLTTFCVVRETPYGPRVSRYRDAPRLRALLSDFMLRRVGAVELPPVSRGEIVVEPRECGEPGTLAALRALDPMAAALIGRAATVANFDDLDTPHVATLRRLIGLAKVRATAERAAALLAAEPDAKLVLFCMHRAVMQQLMLYLRDANPVLLAGGESDRKRAEAKHRFQHEPACRVAVCQMRAAGTGLTLTAANHLWIVEPSWTPSDNDQACRRIVRIGQTRATKIQFVTLDTSLDHVVNRVLRQKRQLIDEIINSTCVN